MKMIHFSLAAMATLICRVHAVDGRPGSDAAGMGDVDVFAQSPFYGMDATLFNGGEDHEEAEPNELAGPAQGPAEAWLLAPNAHTSASAAVPDENLASLQSLDAGTRSVEGSGGSSYFRDDDEDVGQRGGHASLRGMVRRDSVDLPYELRQPPSRAAQSLKPWDLLDDLDDDDEGSFDFWEFVVWIGTVIGRVARVIIMFTGRVAHAIYLGVTKGWGKTSGTPPAPTPAPNPSQATSINY